MKKIFYVVLDGVSDGDYRIPGLGDRTPLEVAEIPNIDGLAKDGQGGLMYTVGKGIAPQSDIAVISILGYDPNVYYTGRGPLESFAAGLEVNPGDLALRANFATRGEGKKIIDRRVGRDLSTEEAKILADAVNREVKLTSVPSASFEFLSTVGHRAVLVIRTKSQNLSGQIINVDPAYDKVGALGVANLEFEMKVQKVEPTAGHEDSEEAQNAAKLVNEFVERSSKVLEKHDVNKKRIAKGNLPGNLILLRDAGDKLPEFPPFKEHFGLNFATFVEMPVERGIAMLMELEIVELPGSTDILDKDYELRANLAKDSIEKFDGLYIHIKGTDEPAHDGDYERKIRIIEQIDKHFFGQLLKQINLKQSIVVITADHSTPCIKKSHTDDPVPLLISGGNLKADSVKAFTEKECASGCLGTLKKGTELIPLLKKCAEKWWYSE